MHQVITLSVGLVILSGNPAQAVGLGRGVFSLWLECNNDGVGHVIGANDPINGWQYTSDARNDNTDGYFYDIAGIAVKQINNEVVVAISGNTPITGTGFDRQANQVVWGDLFFSDGTQSFTDAMNTGNLYGIRFAGTNESGAGQVGVYNNVVATGVGVNNFGHRTYSNYTNVVGSEGTSQNRFLGDMGLADLEGDDSYFDGSGPGYNVIGQGTRVQNDGFTLLGLDDGLLQDLDLGNFAAQGDHTIAFKFNQSALQYQPTPQEMAAEYGVEWIWDEQGITPEDMGINELDEGITDATDEAAQIQSQQIKPLNQQLEAQRKTVDGYAEAKALRNASSNLSDAEEQLKVAQGVLNVLTPKKAAWDKMTEAERQAASPEAVWTRKDDEDWAYQQEQVSLLQQEINTIKALYSEEELASAEKNYNQFIKNELRNHADEEFRQNYLELEAKRKTQVRARNEQRRIAEELDRKKEALEEHIESLLADARQDVLNERLAASETAAKAELALETEQGGPRTQDYGIPTTEAEYRAAVSDDTKSVPEPSTLIGALIALGLGTRLKSR